MKKIIGLFTIAICSMGILKAQITDVTPPVAARSSEAVKDSTAPAIAQQMNVNDGAEKAANNKKKFSNIDLSHRGADHFMIQLGGMGLGGATSDFKTKGFSREFNFSFMLDKPFKTNPHYSLGFGIGYSSANLFFNGKYIDIKSTSAQLPTPTTNITGSSNTFNKFKVTLNYFEVPVELRYSANIEHPNKGFRIAFGLKGGYLLGAHSKGKNEMSSEGSTVYGKGYIEKQYSKRFFKTTRLDGTVRIGYGLFSLYGTYQLTPLLNTGAGPSLNPYSIGLGIGIM